MTQNKAQVRPLVTFALFAYNQEKYIREAIEGAFAQTYEPLEIIISDDCSTDNTYEIIKKMVKEYKGPHRVLARKNLQNVGIACHFDILIRKSKGELFIIAAGDDVSMADRSEKSVEAYLSNKNMGVFEVACRNFSGEYKEINSNSESSFEDVCFSLMDVLDGFAPSLIGAGRSYVRARYVTYSPLMSGCPEEDTPALFRCLYANYGIYSYRSLVYRRVHGENLSDIENLKKVDFNKLGEQYFADIAESARNKIVDETEYGLILGKIKAYLFRKRVRVAVHAGFQGDVSIADVLVSNFISPRQKVGYLKKWLSYKLTIHKSGL